MYEFYKTYWYNVWLTNVDMIDCEKNRRKWFYKALHLLLLTVYCHWRRQSSYILLHLLNTGLNQLEMVLQLKGTVWVTRQKQERDLLYYCQASVIIALAVVS
jgi:hypothetical protein